jgi:hypothetical protein
LDTTLKSGISTILASGGRGEKEEAIYRRGAEAPSEEAKEQPSNDKRR